MATSSTITVSPLSISFTERSNISALTMISFVRCSNLRMLSRPVITTVPLSIEVTRVIGTKILRRGGTSIIKPSTRGG